MKKIFFLFLISISKFSYGISEASRNELQKMYEQACYTYSDINQHIPVLFELAKNCSTVIEIGVRSMVSTWGLLQGLAKSSASHRIYLGIDLVLPPAGQFNLAKQLTTDHEIIFDFWTANDLYIDIPVTDLLFIDSLHTYCHLMNELERFSPKVRKYIALHDTSAPWGDIDDTQYNGDYSEYPAHFDRTKRGLWPAVVDFLASHPEWFLKERRFNNHGFTILERKSYN